MSKTATSTLQNEARKIKIDEKKVFRINQTSVEPIRDQSN
jgi:hypothetical protein